MKDDRGAIDNKVKQSHGNSQEIAIVKYETLLKINIYY